MCICVLAHPLAGSSAIPLGILDDDRVKSVRRCPLSRSSTEIVSGVASVQYSLFVIQSIAKPSLREGYNYRVLNQKSVSCMELYRK